MMARDPIPMTSLGLLLLLLLSLSELDVGDYDCVPRYMRADGTAAAGTSHSLRPSYP